MNRQVKTILAVALISVGLVVGPVPSFAQEAGEPAAVTARPITSFRLNSGETRFGKLDFIGGLVLGADNPLFGALSSIRFLPDHKHFMIVMDTGHWLRGRITRDGEGRLKSIEDVVITSMIDRMGRTEADKFDMDSEGLAFRDGDALVSFERRHRVDVYPGPDFETARPRRTIGTLIPPAYLKTNGSFETIAVAPKDGSLQGAAVVVTERSVDKDGNLYAAILDGPLKGRFAVRHHDSFDVSDGVFLPNGDLVLLQRRFTMALGIGLRIIRIKGADIRPGAVVDGEILMEADMGEQIDNMEGIDAVPAPDGSTHLILVSDDNHSILQRSLMLEFKLVE